MFVLDGTQTTQEVQDIVSVAESLGAALVALQIHPDGSNRHLLSKVKVHVHDVASHEAAAISLFHLNSRLQAGKLTPKN